MAIAMDSSSAKVVAVKIMLLANIVYTAALDWFSGQLLSCRYMPLVNNTILWGGG